MPTIEMLALANHAEAREGLLYLTGAGWSYYWTGNKGPEGQLPSAHFGIGLSILVPWTETNQKHQLKLKLEHEDGQPVIFEAGADIEMGRPPGIAPGSEQRAVLALNIDTVFEVEGGYRLVADLADSDRKATSFTVKHAAMPGTS